MADLPKISIVMVNYNQPELTAQCLDSIYKTPPKASYEIVLVDNASADGSADWLEQNYPDVHLIRSERNTGIAGGNNLGIKNSEGEYILLLNNDTLVIPGTIDRTIQFLEDHLEASGVGGNLLNGDSSFQFAYADFHTLWSVFLILTKLGFKIRDSYPSYCPSSEILTPDWQSTAFMTFRREALESIGFIDEDFFIYSDETDLQFRLKQQGWVNYYLPDLETIHFEGKSLKPWIRRRLVYRGILLFFHKHRGFFQTFILRLMYIAICSLKIPYWALAALSGNIRERAKHELDSNLSIIRMSIRPGIESP